MLTLFMKTFYTSLVAGILLLTCYLEKRKAVPLSQLPQEALVTNSRFFVGGVIKDCNPARVVPFRMKLRIKGSYLKGSYRSMDSDRDVEVTGLVNTRQELELTASLNGKQTGVFKGKMENGNGNLLRLSGIWANNSGKDLSEFLVNEVR
jgi:hypothetical protein